MRHRTAQLLTIVSLAAGLSAIGATPSRAQDDRNNPTFGSRTDKPDGSVALTIGRRLPTEWDTQFGMDANLTPDLIAAGTADPIAHGTAAKSSSGVVWGSVTGAAPIIWDKTSVDARFDPTSEQGKVAATLSRTVPLGDSLSVTLQDRYSVTQTLQGSTVTSSRQATGQSSGAMVSAVWDVDRSLRLNLTPTGTTLSAGVATSNGDSQWHHKLSAEQKLYGPLSVTTSVSDPGTAASNKSIAAGFKHTW
jgi:hypothetical protein